MIDPVIFTSIVQGGSFALVVFIICWFLFKVHPASREDWNKKETDNRATIQLMHSENKASMERMQVSMEKKDASHTAVMETAIKTFGEATQKVVAENRQLVEMLATKHGTAVDRLIEKSSQQEDKRASECREEREQWMTVVSKLPSQIQKVLSDVLEEVLEEGTKRGKMVDNNNGEQVRRG